MAFRNVIIVEEKISCLSYRRQFVNWAGRMNRPRVFGHHKRRILSHESVQLGEGSPEKMGEDTGRDLSVRVPVICRQSRPTHPGYTPWRLPRLVHVAPDTTWAGRTSLLLLIPAPACEPYFADLASHHRCPEARRDDTRVTRGGRQGWLIRLRANSIQ